MPLVQFLLALDSYSRCSLLLSLSVALATAACSQLSLLLAITAAAASSRCLLLAVTTAAAACCGYCCYCCLLASVAATRCWFFSVHSCPADRIDPPGVASYHWERSTEGALDNRFLDYRSSTHFVPITNMKQWCLFSSVLPYVILQSDQVMQSAGDLFRTGEYNIIWS